MSRGLNYRKNKKHKRPREFSSSDIIVILMFILFILVYMLSNGFNTNPWTPPDTVIVKTPPIVVVREPSNSSLDIDISVKTLVNPEQLEMLAHLIYAESGSDYCSDEMQLYVGSVVLNRINSDEFPNTMHEVIEQPGQYAVRNYYMNMEINDRAYNNAIELLLNGSKLPDNVVFQANFRQGSELYKKVDNMYFCYK